MSVNKSLALGACIASMVALACSGPPSEATTELRPLDAASFEQYVQPYLEASCATLDCHGDRGRPLRLYSELGLRREDALRPVSISEGNEPLALTADELIDNRLAFAAVGLSTKRSEEPLALTKPLAKGSGGIEHEGGVHFASREDPGYLCLRAWLLADVRADIGALCAQALAAVQR